MVCSSGRLGGLMLEAGLCEVAEVLACVEAQLAGGPLPDNVLLDDVEADLRVLVRVAPIEDAVRLSARVVEVTWVRGADAMHAHVASRLLAMGREGEAESALMRVRWHGSLLDWIEGHATSAGVRARLIARAAELVEATRLPREYQVDLFVRLAVLSRETGFLDEARAALKGLPEELRAATPDLEAPITSLACGLARLGLVEEALAEIEVLVGIDRTLALLQLMPWVGERRAELIEWSIMRLEPEGVVWFTLLAAAPELGERALRDILAMTDVEMRASAVAVVTRALTGEVAREACAWLVARARGLAAGSEEWEQAWGDALSAMVEKGCEDLLDEAVRRELVAELLARPELELWAEVGPFVPTELAEAVLAVSFAGLEVADHYRMRDRWIALGRLLLGRVAPASAERWLKLAAVQAVGTAIEERPLAELAMWSAEQRRDIVMGRLAQHQREFLPQQLLAPLLEALARAMPPRDWPDWDGWISEALLARLRGRDAVDEVVVRAAPADDAWPGFEEFVGVVLGAGEGAAAKVVAAFSAVRRAG